MNGFNDVNTFAMLTAMALVAAVLARRVRDVTYPALVFVGPIYLQYILYFFIYNEDYHLSSMTNAMLLLGVAAFLVGVAANAAMFHIEHFKKAQPYAKANATYKMDRSRPYLLVLGFAGFVIGLYYAYDYAVSGASSLFFNLRYAATVEGGGLGVAPYLLLFLHIWLLFTICVHPQVAKMKRQQLILVLLLLLVSSLFTMARTGLFLTLISSAGAYYLSRRYIYGASPKAFVSVVMFLFTLVISFGLIAILTKKAELSDVFDSFLLYLGYPVIAFDRFVVAYPGVHNGHNVFYPVARLLEGVGLMSPWVKEIPGVSSTDFNAFTYLNAPYLDFGKQGVAFVSMLLGFVASFVYNNARKGKGFYVVLYSLFLFPLFMSFYEYQFGLVSWIYYLLILMAVYLFTANMRRGVSPKAYGDLPRGQVLGRGVSQLPEVAKR